MARRILLAIVVAILAASLIGCQTVKGVGEDIKSVGEAGERAVD